MDQKPCTKCGIVKPLTDYYVYTKNGRPFSECKTCRIAVMKKYQQTSVKNAAYRRAYKLKSLYTLTVEQYEALLEAQGGVCAICGVDSPGNGKRENFSVDHDHACCPGKVSCGKCVRGLLCLRCNNSLGWLETHRLPVDSYLAQYAQVM